MRGTVDECSCFSHWPLPHTGRCLQVRCSQIVSFVVRLFMETIIRIKTVFLFKGKPHIYIISLEYQDVGKLRREIPVVFP